MMLDAKASTPAWPVLVGLIFLVACSDSGLPEGDSQAGKRLYWQGLTREAQPVPVSVQGDVQTGSDNFACVGCHRPSGYGSSEGGRFVPPITQPVLFESSRSDRQRRNRRFRDLFKEDHDANFAARVRMPRLRPAYNDQSLARAIRQGVDSKGRTLAEAMPRYDLNDQAVADLIAYLKTLSVENSPGVTPTHLKLATVVADTVNPRARKAMLDTLRSFVNWYNKDIEGDLRSPGFSPFYRSEFKDSYRYWDLEVWELTGPRETWRYQLENYYKQKPAFALVSGLVTGPWKPVDRFCRARSLPCVFPNTELPNLDAPDYGYSIYFSRGLALEAEVLAQEFSTRSSGDTKLHQIYINEPAGRVPAEALSGQLAGGSEVLGSPTLTSQKVDSQAALIDAIEAIDDPTADVVVWPGSEAGDFLEALQAGSPRLHRLFLPSTALAEANSRVSGQLRHKLRFGYPYEKPGGYHPRKYRVRAWMHSRGLDVSHPQLQLQTYYALTQTQFAIANVVDDFSRDYFIEFIERQAEAKLNPGSHPSLSLGPGQRFASKGAYIMRLKPEKNGGFVADTEWIVPP